ncbi:MAG: dockerin type I domain-containing protein, partial [Pirellulales bacterium]|nr:dockerin type I domain-containing protein [Pirellulales bacterium]
MKVRRRLLVEHLGDRRVLATISGAVYDDANFSFQRDPSETTLGHRLVYIDANDNATLDNGEQFVVAADNGSFAFPNLQDGTYILRLFNGTASQQQTAPVEATLAGEVVTVGGNQLVVPGSGAAIALNSQAVVLGDLETGEAVTIPVASEVSDVQTLPDGSLLVIGTDSSGQTAWIVDPSDQSVTPVDLDGNGTPVPWSDVAIDGNGRGVLLEHSNTATFIRSIDASDPQQGIQVSTTTTSVPAGTQVLTSSNGHRSVLGSSDGSGLHLSLWSNVTSTLITETPIDVDGTHELLAYDDASGLLVLRTFEGGVSIHDVDQNFATLHNFSDITGPVAIDGARDLLMAISPVDAMLRMINIRDGSLIADLAVDLSSIGQVASLAVGNRPDAIVVLGAAGMTEIALNKAAANRVRIEGGQDVDAVLFGVALNGSNTAPAYQTLPELVTAEDTGFSKPAPAALLGQPGFPGAIDAQGDSFLLIQTGPASQGSAALTFQGAITYTPNQNFFGTDTVPVVLHDGRDVSGEFDLEIQVTPTSDPPIDIRVEDAVVPESILPGTAVTEIEVVDFDLEDNHLIQIHDGRFEVQNGQIIFVRGEIDFESEPLITLDIYVTDPDTNTEIDKVVTLTVEDDNDPITAITPNVGSVIENVFGDFVVQLHAEDQDQNQTHQFTVDDDRFVFDLNQLKLAEDVAVDFEQEPVIKVNVTAVDGAGSSLTQEITVHVLDIAEQPQSITLTNESVVELEPGAVVGDVLLDGAVPDNRFELTVDDPRFEIEGNTLQLIEGQSVERATQEEIQLAITARDTLAEFDSVTDTFVIEVLENHTPFHNDANPYDVDQNTVVTSRDALLVINYLNSFGPGPVGQGDPGFGYDVNGDGFVTALDALLILNEVNRLGTATGAVGEGEQIAQENSIPAGQPNSNHFRG